MIDAALQYAGRGWAVFPVHGIGEDGRCTCGRACASPGKHPATRRGFRDASRDPAQVAAWWARRPGANVAVATGAASGGLVVLDVDGPAGEAELRALVAANGRLPRTLAARTGRGLHLYFTSREPVASSARGSLHVRGDGGYVVAPPSRHASGRAYAWVDASLPPAPLPDWLRTWAQGGAAPSESGGAVTPAQREPDHLARMARRGLAQTALQAISRAESTWSRQEQERIESALAAIPADSYEIWVKVGMVLQGLQWLGSDGTDYGLTLWDRWSATCREKYAPGACEDKWRSFGRSTRAGLGLGSLFALAQERGWRGQGPTENRDRNQAGASAGDVTEPPGAQINGHASITSALPAIFSQSEDVIAFPDLDRAGRARGTCRNARAALRRLELTCRHDLFHRRMTVGGRVIERYAGEVSDDAIQMLRVVIERACGFDPGLANTHDAVIQECLQHPHDPVCDYLDGLAWDGEARVDTWTTRYLGAADTLLHRATGRLALIAAVRRARQPGAKFDQIVVLEGAEGRGKSSAIKILAGEENFSDQTVLPLGDKEQQEALQGVWLYEIADLTGIGRAEVEKIKAFASRTIDRARPAYGRARVDRPRRCVFFATTNNETYLKSQTGNRRFWPLAVGRIDLDALARDRDQLWAEAARQEGQGASLALPAALWGEAAATQAARVDHDPWDDVLRDLKGEVVATAEGAEERVASRDIYEVQLRLGAHQMTDSSAKRLAYAMRRLGWDGPTVFRTGKKSVRGYVRRASYA